MKIVSSLLSHLSLIGLITIPAFAGDMTLIHSGENLILHDDNSWEFENKNAEELEENFEITLDDNRIIFVSVDGTWRFVEKSELKARDVLPVNHISAKGTARHVVLSEASGVAMKNAVSKATKKLKAAIKTKKLNFNRLQDCVRRVEKDVDSEESFTKGKGWSVTTQIILDKGSILAVLDCEEVKKEKGVAKKSEGKPKDEKAAVPKQQ